MKINKGQFVLSRCKQLQFDYKRAKGHIFSYLKNRFYWHYIPRLERVMSFPDHVDIEISSVCNLKCPMCYTTLDDFNKNVKKQFMDIELFKKIVDECAKYNVYSIRISLRGEAFLHKDVIPMIAYAKQAGIKEIASLSNVYSLSEDKFEDAMKAGLGWLTLSFDGLYDKYEFVRNPAKFDEMYDRVKRYKEIKKHYRSLKPVIKIQSVWSAIKEDPLAYWKAFEPYVDNIASNPIIDYLHKDSEDQIEYEENFTCPVLYQRLVIGADGKVLLCSNDEMGKYIIGDANRESLYAIWHGDRMTSARNLHKRRRGHLEIACCKECFLPRKTEAVEKYMGRHKLVIDQYIGRKDAIGE